MFVKQAYAFCSQPMDSLYFSGSTCTSSETAELWCQCRFGAHLWKQKCTPNITRTTNKCYTTETATERFRPTMGLSLPRNSNHRHGGVFKGSTSSNILT